MYLLTGNFVLKGIGVEGINIIVGILFGFRIRGMMVF